MNLDNLTNKQKDNLINRLALYQARNGRDCSALVYVKNGEAINRVLEFFEDFINKEIELETFNF
jgi:hypothetical protein